MIRADEATGADCFAPLYQSRTPVLADVQKDMRFALLISRNEQRPAKAVMGHGHIGLRDQRRGRNHLRQSVEQLRFLAREMGRIGIGRRGNRCNASCGAHGSVGNLLGECLLAEGWREHVHGNFLNYLWPYPIFALGSFKISGEQVA